MNNTIPFHSAPHAPQITVDVNILSMLKQAASRLSEMASENVYLAAIGPDMELTIIMEEDAPSVLPCFDEDDALISVKGAPLFISYNPAQVLKLAGKAVPDRPGHSSTAPTWAQRHRHLADQWRTFTCFQTYLESHSTTLMADGPEADLHLHRLRCAMLNFFIGFAFFEAGAYFRLLRGGSDAGGTER